MAAISVFISRCILPDTQNISPMNARMRPATGSGTEPRMAAETIYLTSLPHQFNSLFHSNRIIYMVHEVIKKTPIITVQ